MTIWEKLGTNEIKRAIYLPFIEILFKVYSPSIFISSTQVEHKTYLMVHQRNELDFLNSNWMKIGPEKVKKNKNNE